MSRFPAFATRLAVLLPWLPCCVGGCIFAVLALLGDLHFDLFLAMLAGSMSVLVWIGLRLWVQALLFAALLAPLTWHFLVGLPAAEPLEHLPIGAEAAIEGTLRDRWTAPGPNGAKAVQLLLGEVHVEADDIEWSGAEALVTLPAKSAWSFTVGRQIRVAGSLDQAILTDHRLSLQYTDADWHFMGESYSPSSLEALRVRLRARAAYYLHKPAQAVYLPLVLDLRDRASPEGREVIGEFRRVGISHLFAISGLNIAMIFGLLMVLQRYVTWILSPGQGWIHGRTAARLAIVAFIWAYIALIGYPVTAVRAATMGSLLIWTELWGTRTPGWYVLVVTGLAMAALVPSVLYDISFQLSFMAYFFLTQAMTLAGALRRIGRGLLAKLGRHDSGAAAGQVSSSWRRLARRLEAWCVRLAKFSAENIWVTGVVMVGLWPVMTARFHTLSLLVFAGNLLLVPAMELVLMPVAMAALVISTVCAASPPGMWIERWAYGALELGLDVWARIVHVLDRAGGTLMIRIDLNWTFLEGLTYYAAFLLGVRGLVHWARRVRIPRL